MPAQPASGSGVFREGVIARWPRGTSGDVRAGRRAGCNVHGRLGAGDPGVPGRGGDGRSRESYSFLDGEVKEVPQHRRQ